MGLIIEINERVSVEARRESVVVMVHDKDTEAIEVRYTDVSEIIDGLLRAVMERAPVEVQRVVRSAARRAP